MEKILLYIWQLPQNLLALCIMLVCRIIYGKARTEMYKGVKYLWYDGWRNGVSLGNYVLLGTVYERDDIVKHEWGHTCQSREQGWLYLIFTGIPSGLGNLYDRIVRTKKNGWTWEESTKAYYSMPWEKRADEYGGTSWEEHIKKPEN